MRVPTSIPNLSPASRYGRLVELCLDLPQQDADSFRLGTIGGQGEDLLQLSRLGRQAPQLHTVALGELLEQARTEVLEAATEERAIDWQIGELPQAEVDATLFRQVWTNLLSNVIKFSRNRPR